MKVVRELIAVFGVLSAIFVVVFNYRDLPQRIPTHFGITGVADGWGGKSSLWALVGVTCFLYAVLSLVRFLPPKLMNVPVTEEHRAAAIPISLEMVGWVKAEITCMFDLYRVVSGGGSAGAQPGARRVVSPRHVGHNLWNVAVLYPADEKAGEIGRGHHRLKKSPGWIEPVGQGDEVAAVLQFPARFSRQ